ncbi:low molecular weight protein arginine phosphatase [Thermodesulfobacteriota bacterium]
MKILFVCTANISRSFLAEKLMQHEIELRQLTGVFVKSAGVYANPGSLPDPKMVAYLNQNQIVASDHASSRIDDENIRWADHILVMEKSHAEEIVRLWPDAGEKVDLLGRFVSMDGSADDVVDPFGRTPFHYRLAQSQIVMGVTRFIETRI